MNKKTYVLDTNVLIQDPDSIFKFEDNNVVLSGTTIDELDRLKKYQGEVGYSARKASRNIETLRIKGDILKGVEINQDGGVFRIELECSYSDMPSNWDKGKPDNTIIMTAKKLLNNNENAILISKDLLVRIKSSIVNVPVQDYKNEIVDDEILKYNGRAEIYVTSDDISKFYKNEFLEYNDDKIKLYENQFVMLIDEANFKHTGIGRYTNGKIVKLLYEKESPYSITPRNVGQRYAIEALLSPAEIAPLVILKGPAGTAKTFLSMACGLEKICNDNEYRRMMITRANTSLDSDIGFLPGDEVSKVNPLVRGCLDNLELLSEESVDDLIKNDIISIQALGYLRGRSITEQFLVIDEAQNTSPNQMLGILTRAGEGTKIVICGDLDQIDNTKLDKHTNGLAFAIEKMRDSKLCWIVGFDQDECTRSALAMEAAERMIISDIPENID